MIQKQLLAYLFIDWLISTQHAILHILIKTRNIVFCFVFVVVDFLFFIIALPHGMMFWSIILVLLLDFRDYPIVIIFSSLLLI